jgi:hypothetical protein
MTVFTTVCQLTPILSHQTAVHIIISNLLNNHSNIILQYTPNHTNGLFPTVQSRPEICERPEQANNLAPLKSVII